jgi:hypothetical protein
MTPTATGLTVTLRPPPAERTSSSTPVLITGEDRVKADMQRTLRDLHDLARETED